MTVTISDQERSMAHDRPPPLDASGLLPDAHVPSARSSAVSAAWIEALLHMPAPIVPIGHPTRLTILFQ